MTIEHHILVSFSIESHFRSAFLTSVGLRTLGCSARSASTSNQISFCLVDNMRGNVVLLIVYFLTSSQGQDDCKRALLSAGKGSRLMAVMPFSCIVAWQVRKTFF